MKSRLFHIALRSSCALCLAAPTLAHAQGGGFLDRQHPSSTSAAPAASPNGWGGRQRMGAASAPSAEPAAAPAAPENARIRSQATAPGGWQQGNWQNRRSGAWNGGTQTAAATPPAENRERRGNRGGNWNNGGWNNHTTQAPNPVLAPNPAPRISHNQNRYGQHNSGWQQPAHHHSGNWQNTNSRHNPGWNNGTAWANNWNRAWRNDNRYDWKRYRDTNRYNNARWADRYWPPYGVSYNYRRLGIGGWLDSRYAQQAYWISDPWAYRLPSVDWPLMWLRYYDDVLLVDVSNGYVVDVIYNFY